MTLKKNLSRKKRGLKIRNGGTNDWKDLLPNNETTDLSTTSLTPKEFSQLMDRATLLGETKSDGWIYSKGGPGPTLIENYIPTSDSNVNKQVILDSPILITESYFKTPRKVRFSLSPGNHPTRLTKKSKKKKG